ncbi:MAG: DUF4292 domain-containing protein [Desulfatirhabdiaceae bacterium]
METKQRIYLVFAMMAFLILPSCSGLLSMPAVTYQPDSPEITRILSELRSRNVTIASMKGIGRIKIWNSDQTQTARTAWTIAKPDKIRILIMAVSGFPVASLAADGQSVYLMSHSDNRFYQKETPDASLEQMLNLPIQSRELIEIVSGAIPVRDHMASSLNEDGTSGQAILTLTGQYGRPCEILYLDSGRRNVNGITFYDDAGDLEYRVVYSETKEIDGYSVPSRMMLDNDENAGIQVDMEKIWINSPVSPDMFVLSPP